MQYETIHSLEYCLDSLLYLAKNNNQILKNLYVSADCSFLEHSLWNICNQLAIVCTDKFTKESDISKLDYQIFVLDFKCIFFGFTLEWLESGMKEDMSESIHRLCEIKSGVIECMLHNCERRPL